MPEGDTVHQAAGRLHQALAGQELTVSDLRVPRLATVDLTGRTVLEVVARGKHLLTRLEGGLTLHSHLRMDGSWRIFAPGERWRGGPGHQIRAVLGTASRTAVGYRLPVLELLRTPAEDEAVGHLGPDLLGPDWSPAEALARLELPDPERLTTLAARLLEANRHRPRRTTTGRPDRPLYVYGRAGRPCLRCGTLVRTAQQGDPTRERPTYWCPGCQTGPAPAA